MVCLLSLRVQEQGGGTCTHPSPCHPTPIPATRLLCPALQGLLRESQQANERLQKECSALAERAARLHHTLEDHIHSNTQLLADNSQRQVRRQWWVGGCWLKTASARCSSGGVWPHCRRWVRVMM